MSLQQIPGHYVISSPGSVDSATCSAIASAYAESAVSSVSGNYYTTANESGYALSADVSGTVDLVSSQSANWGGSALALSAGPGVKLEKSGNVLVASTDETLLWSGSASAGQFNLSEPKTNFKLLSFYVNDVTGYNATFNVDATSNVESFMAIMPYPNSSNAVIFKYQTLSATSESSLSSIMRGRSVLVNGSSTDVSTNAANCLFVTQIYGINRTAEA